MCGTLSLLLVRVEKNNHIHTCLRRKLVMLACLLIDNCDDRLIEISELLAFYSLKWELADNGVIYIDFDSISSRIKVLIYELKLREMQVRIGVAPTRLASLAAAHAASVETPLFISPTQLEAFLADQSVSYLPISGENQERLEMLGLGTLGQLARIDVGELVNQFGKEGKLMSELARGIDLTPFPPELLPAGADEDMRQMGIWNGRKDAETHRQPVQVSIVADDAGYPQSLLIEGMELFITDIVDLWTVENRWWMEQRTNCEYFEVVELGAKWTSILCHDLDRGEWYKH